MAKQSSVAKMVSGQSQWQRTTPWRQERKLLRRNQWRQWERMGLSPSERLAKSLEFLVKGASKQDIEWLLDDERVGRAIYEFDAVNDTLVVPCIPWTSMYVLGRFNPKHCWCSRKAPQVDDVRSSIVDFENKARWRIKLKHVDSTTSLRVPHSRTPPCRVFDPAL